MRITWKIEKKRGNLRPVLTYTVTLDGFILSDNMECISYENINTGYSYSDHDPVYMKFKLKS